ncbi:hypothetical protein [Mycobacterium sp. shizuoka-1]|uniref:hypothetical protein n=1 Tax=Mycobacterium sp. shizuoka-1 TaxID=2039281 RepID=UPI000C084D22|nr:hypothetical protein [Mycobacterium sp. shizuoka-1]
MARIRSLAHDKKPARPPATEVDCLYTSVRTRDGETLLRFATMGSDSRKLEPKPSQIIELDEMMARQFLRAILEIFPAALP